VSGLVLLITSLYHVPSSRRYHFPEVDWFISAFAIFITVCVAGVASGLTVGLFSIDPLKLEVILQDTERAQAEKDNARALQPVLANHHFLLVTLLVVNSAATESMPIFLDSLVPAWAAVMISVTFVLLFGEVVLIFSLPLHFPCSILAALCTSARADMAELTQILFPFAGHPPGAMHQKPAGDRRALLAGREVLYVRDCADQLADGQAA
jgi:hypothetical protein